MHLIAHGKTLLVPGRAKGPVKTLLIMQLTAILLLTATLQVSASVRAQITLSEHQAPLEKVLKEIKTQSGYAVFYDAVLLQKAHPVDIRVRDLDLTQTLDLLFRDQPLTYELVGNNIITVKARPEAPAPVQPGHPAPPPPIDIHGRVTDSLGNPLAGASVTVKGIRKGIQTDKNGDFVLSGIKDNATLIISYTGYSDREYKVNGQATANITLVRSTSSLDEIQVIAYGTTTQRLNTGNVTTIKAADIEKQPVNNPLLALEGRVPGLFITQASGFAGSGVTVRIQGINSIGGGNDPLYVIDGVPYISELLPAISTTLGSSGAPLVNHSISYGSPLSYINPADIESIDILKDADATAIYGSRAANGAILITTKKGKAGEQKVEFNLQQGWGKVTRRMDLLSRRQYLDMRYEALRNDGVDLAGGSPTSTDFYDLKVWDTTRYTDWQKTLIGNTVQYTDLQSNVSGGNANTFYSIGGGYHRETTVMPGDFNDQKGSLHFQINSTSANQKFRLRLIGNYTVDINRLPSNADGTDLTAVALQLAPDAPPLYNKDGSINWAPDPNGNSTWDLRNPVAQLLNKYQNNTNNLVNNALLSYQVIPGLYIKSSFGYTNLQTSEKVMIPLSSTAPELRQNTTRIGVYGNSHIHSWIVEPQLSYELRLAKGKLEALVGSTIQQNNSEEEKLSGAGYATDEAIQDIHSASQVTAGPTIDFVYKYNALFGRLNYNWQDKYIVNLNVRRDGSSRFGAQSQFHDFGSIGAAWIFTQENFFKNRFPFLSYGKLSGSYGTTGNDQIGEYQFLSLYNPVTYGVPYQGINTLQPNNLPNPYLQWEETRKLHVGIGLGFMRDRLLVNADYFHNRSSNQLLGYQLPATTGFTSISANFPATVQNTGWELSVNSINIQTKRIKWSTSINLTIPRNKLIAFPGIATSTYANILVVGQPITIVRKFHLIGVDPSTGKYYFDSKTNPSRPQFPDDANTLINNAPDLYGGIQNSFTYGGFQLDILFQFVLQKGPNYFLGRFPGSRRLNQPVYVLDRWRKPGDIASHQRYNSDFSLGQAYIDAAYTSDGDYSDASYIRLKNLSFSWQAPERVLKSIRLHDIRVFVQAQNLLTVTRYKGLDPETLSSASLPPLRVITTGMKVSL